MASKWRAPAGRAESFPAGLYVTATPIGNLRDITLRALDVLAGADVIACEDTRQTGKLLAAYSIKTPMTAYHDHSDERARARLLALVAEGKRVALVSDAGTPLISDPGYKLVAEARGKGLAVFTIPGASSVPAALAISGLPTDRFLFVGFIPPKEAGRRRVLESLKSVPATTVYFESPRRLAAFLADAAAVMGARKAAVARELTKTFEDVRTGTLDELAAAYASEDTPKGEIVVLIAPPTDEYVSEADVDLALQDALETLSVKDAAAQVAEMTGKSKRDLYARALELKNQ